MSSEIQVPGSSQSLVSAGVLLSNERVKRGISIQEAADYLKLSRKQVEALENDDYSSLPGTTFVRGFMRNYAKFLELDLEPIMAWLDSQVPNTAPDARPAAVTPQGTTASTESHKEKDTAPATPATTNADTGSGIWKWLLPLLLVGAGLVWYQSQPSEATEANTEAAAPAEAVAKAPVATTPPVAETAATPPAPPAEAPQTPPPSAAATPAAPPPVTVTTAAPAVTPPTPAATTTTATAAPALPSNGNHQLRLVMKQDSWMEILDSKGERVVFGTQKAGKERIVEGTPPFKMTIGNATEVELFHNNQAIDLKKHIKKGTTAKLELQ
ncbi:MAG: helix-turn-helix domain-containing protein [Aquaspirillum sp.]